MNRDGCALKLEGGWQSGSRATGQHVAAQLGDFTVEENTDIRQQFGLGLSASVYRVD